MDIDVTEILRIDTSIKGDASVPRTLIDRIFSRLTLRRPPA
ncbi:MAG: hypothetical protein R3E44_05615 [Paracoccaceae bacterium]